MTKYYITSLLLRYIDASNLNLSDINTFNNYECGIFCNY